VRTLGGGTKPFYRYICDDVNCDDMYGESFEWQQIPPYKLNDEALCIRVRKKDKNERTKPYRCSKCGAPDKKGHECVHVTNTTNDTVKICDEPTSLLEKKPPLNLFVSFPRLEPDQD
jgi:hypothetical protein